jgi:16S rRNA (guanine527-N7)-methyltransferase
LTPEAVRLLAAYLDTLSEWSGRLNLTGWKSPSERVARLVGDVLPVAGLVEPGTLLDVGSGNGSPGLVLAVLRVDMEVTLFEPRVRRWAFLREAVRRVERSVRVLRVRHDAYDGPAFRTVALRALSLRQEELGSLVEPGGRLIVLGRRPEGQGPFEESHRTGVPRGVWIFERLPGTVPRETRR